jgi:hypothetical protein
MITGPEVVSSWARRSSSMPDMPGSRMATTENARRLERAISSSASSAVEAASGV